MNGDSLGFCTRNQKLENFLYHSMFHSRGVKGLSGDRAGSTQLYTLSDSEMERNSIIRGLLSDVTFPILFKQISTNAPRTTEAANRFASTGLEDVISAPVDGDIC